MGRVRPRSLLGGGGGRRCWTGGARRTYVASVAHPGGTARLALAIAVPARHSTCHERQQPSHVSRTPPVSHSLQIVSKCESSSMVEVEAREADTEARVRLAAAGCPFVPERRRKAAALSRRAGAP